MFVHGSLAPEDGISGRHSVSDKDQIKTKIKNYLGHRRYTPHITQKRCTAF